MAQPQEPATKEQAAQILSELKQIKEIALANERLLKRILQDGTQRI